MFQSATLKLTGWYLLILMVISLIFSVAIYQTTTQEVNTRLEKFEHSLQVIPGFAIQPAETMRSGEADAAASHIIFGLVLANSMIFVVGGVISYLLARRTLRPIQDMHEAQSRFTSDASHELRTPLAAMRTEIEVALRDKSATKKDASKKTQVSQLKKARNSQEVHNCFHVLTIVDGSQSRQKYPEQRGQSSAASGAPRLLLSRQTLNAQKYAVLTIRVSLYSMIASRAQGTRAASALGTRCI